MDIKKQEKQINLNITIPPHKFHKYNEYIVQQKQNDYGENKLKKVGIINVLIVGLKKT